MQRYKQAVALLSTVLSMATTKAEAACTVRDVAGNWRALVLPVRFETNSANTAMCSVTINSSGALSLTPPKSCRTAQLPSKTFVVDSVTGKVRLASKCNFVGDLTIRTHSGTKKFINSNEFVISLSADKARMDGSIQTVESGVFFSDPSLFVMIRQ
jgi:hypothetical protein